MRYNAGPPDNGCALHAGRFANDTRYDSRIDVIKAAPGNQREKFVG